VSLFVVNISFFVGFC